MNGPRYLADTHVLLWMLTEPARLSAEAAATLSAPGNEVLVSSASAWEVSTQHRLGKLPQADVLVRSYSRHLRRLGVRDLEISAEHALLAGSLEWGHRDPFDRMIAAQCMTESLPLVTHDPVFATVPGVRVVW